QQFDERTISERWQARLLHEVSRNRLRKRRLRVGIRDSICRLDRLIVRCDERLPRGAVDLSRHRQSVRGLKRGGGPRHIFTDASVNLARRETLTVQQYLECQ